MTYEIFISHSNKDDILLTIYVSFLSKIILIVGLITEMQMPVSDGLNLLLKPSKIVL